MTAAPSSTEELPNPQRQDAALRIAIFLMGETKRWKADPANAKKVFTHATLAAMIRAKLLIEFPKPKKGPGRLNGRDLIFDAIALACEIDLESITRAAGGSIATAKRDILEASPNVSPEEIERRASLYGRKYRVSITPNGLAAHWPEFGGNGARKAVAADLYTEPVNWRATLRRLYPNAQSLDEKCAGKWLDLSTDLRAEIINAAPPKSG